MNWLGIPRSMVGIGRCRHHKKIIIIAVLCKTCNVLCVLEHPRVDNSITGSLKRGVQLGAIGPICLRSAMPRSLVDVWKSLRFEVCIRSWTNISGVMLVVRNILGLNYLLNTICNCLWEDNECKLLQLYKLILIKRAYDEIACNAIL
jgi:hypothetical protein